MDDATKRTAEHYTKQWGAELDFKGFVQKNSDAAKAMPARQLPWQDLVDRIRRDAASRDILVYDAACGFGDLLCNLTADPSPDRLKYIGADIHGSLDTIERPTNARLVQWDISKALPDPEKFDYIVCRAAIHHTPDPRATYRTLRCQLKAGGTIAITAYAKKAPMREAVDDALRNRIITMSNEDGFQVANQFTRLGRELQACTGEIEIAKDLPLLGIKAGRYKVHDFIYRHFIKCWHNPEFSERHCDLVNFDWYHPPYAYRYEAEDLERWATENGLKVTRQASTEAQHYMEATAI
jgi:SAM-dependent methyltransferase